MSEPEGNAITAAVKRIEALLAARSTPEDVGQAIEDVFETYGQIAQIREVLVQLVEVIRAHDEASKAERAEIKRALEALTANGPVRALDEKVDALARQRGERLRLMQIEVDRLSERVHQLEDAFLDDGQIGLLVSALHQLAVEVEALKVRQVGGEA